MNVRENINSKQDIFSNRIFKDIIWIAIVTVIYLVAGRLSLKLLFKPEGIAAVWPASGIFLSAILLARPKLRPYLIGVLFIADFILEMQAGSILIVSLIYAFSLTLDACLSAWLIIRFVGVPVTFDKVKHVFGFITLSVLLSNALAASLASLAPSLILNAPYWLSWKLWWSSDAVGNLLVAPFIMSWACLFRNRLQKLKVSYVVELLVLLVSMTVVNYFFLKNFSGDDMLLNFLNYLTFPFLIWAAIRFGARGTTVASIILTAGILYFVLNKQLLITVTGSQLSAVIYIQMYLAIISLASLIIAAVVSERRLAEEEIRKLNDELEQRVIERTTKLEALNKELQTFTYSVSHDLKGPLRGIDGFSRLLQELYSDKMNDEAQHFINTIRTSTLQMDQLIDDLLNYSRLERASFRARKINVKKFFNDVKSLYEAEISNRNILFKVMVPDTEIVADINGLTIAAHNLVENAIKFLGQKESPEIEIRLKENISSWILSVKDNGIGFDMKYHNRIFEIFQRLNLPEQFPGTGIGLAMVNKTAERMGGKVWAESKPGEGAVFYFEIPKS
jgi:signal transduction histidine kinase